MKIHNWDWAEHQHRQPVHWIVQLAKTHSLLSIQTLCNFQRLLMFSLLRSTRRRCHSLFVMFILHNHLESPSSHTYLVIFLGVGGVYALCICAQNSLLLEKQYSTSHKIRSVRENCEKAGKIVYIKAWKKYERQWRQWRCGKKEGMERWFITTYIEV